MKKILRITTTVAFACLAAPMSFALEAVRTTAPISLDGKLDEVAWKAAPLFDQFIENMPREKQPAQLRTEVRVLYDDQALYFGLRAYDPDPSKIKADFVRRDKVFSSQDNFNIWIDSTGARKFAQFFRVNPLGILSDGMWNEDATNEDWSPDYDYEAVSMILDDGWSAEFRIPWSSLRVPHPMPEQLTFLVFRNMNRETRMRMSNAVLGREPSCFLCVAEPLTGIKNIPQSSGLSVSPYLTLSTNREREGKQTRSRESELRGGLDVKWRPSSDWVLDATFLPDFSQLELDTPQLKSNTRFALSVPEKRPFFLEGSDLYATPFDSIYTRSITDPRWGARATMRSENLDVMALTVADRGGGFVILPNTYYSDGKAQASSQVTIARARAPFKSEAGTGSFGAMVAHRRYENGAENTVLSTDAVFKPDDATRVRAHLMGSDTRDGDSSRGHVAFSDYSFNDGKKSLYARYEEASPGFRADTSVIGQVGYRSALAEATLIRNTEGFFSQLNPRFNVGERRTWDNVPMQRWITPGIGFNGSRSLEGNVEFRILNYARSREGGLWHHVPAMFYYLEFQPGNAISFVNMNWEFGKGIDVLTDTRVNQINGGAQISFRAHPRLEFELRTNDVVLQDEHSRRTRLIEMSNQLVGVGHISARDTIRWIAQWSQSKRNLAAYENAAEIAGLTPKSRTISNSLVYAHKRGLGREFVLGLTHKTRTTDAGPLALAVPRADTLEAFVKVAYTFNL